MNKKFFILMLFVLFLSISLVSANEYDRVNNTLSLDESDIDICDANHIDDNIDESNNLKESSQKELEADEPSGYIVVNNWEELQYYCAQTDKDYTLKLKENTNFYPNDPNDANYQIKIKNNVKVIGSEGAYIGDNSSNPREIHFVAIIVEDYAKVGLNFENITFKFIKSIRPENSPDGIFIQMGGINTNIIKNCHFSDVVAKSGHSSIVYLKKGEATLTDCSFVNCTTCYGVVGIYDPNSVRSTNMIVRNCYFENNYAETEPGCINNCGRLTVYNSTFFKNRSFWWAGAIHTHSYANTTIYDSNFTDNVAGWNGGALYTYSYLQIHNSIFVGNNCTTNNGGGAIGASYYNSKPHIYIDGCLFEKNENNCWSLDSLSTEGIGRGGAISLMDAGSIEVKDTTFIANAASIGTAICAIEVKGYGSPDVIIVNNSFINHTRMGDVLNVRVNGTILNVSNNYYYGNSIELSSVSLARRGVSNEKAIFEVNVKLAHPNYYDSDILDKTSYEVYVNNEYVKTVNNKVFSVDFGDFDICNVYVVPTISNKKSNEVTVTSTREYIFVSKNKGNDNNNGISRDKPVNTISKALELARNCQNIILLDGDYSEENIQVDYDVTVKGENGATLTNSTSFVTNGATLTLKNLNVNSLNVDNFIRGNVVIYNCIFEDNDVNSIINSSNAEIAKSLFVNNSGVIVYNNGFVKITNSILLDNNQIIANNIEDVDVDYNWWGNTLPDLRINNYLTLNITSDKESLENNHVANVEFNFYLNSIKYFDLPVIELELSGINGVPTKNSVEINSMVSYTLTAFDDALLIANYKKFNSNITFEFVKSNPNISLNTRDVLLFEDVVIQLNFPADCTGNLTVTVGNSSQNKVINSNNQIFTFTGLKPDNYIVLANYSGDRKYDSQILTSNVNVNKYSSTTSIELSAIEVDKDLVLTITTNNGTTGNITLFINQDEVLLNLTNSVVNYTICSISRGDYLIKAIYNGDSNYEVSHDSKFIEVDNLNATMNINVDDIRYGDAAIVNVTLNYDAMGQVIVTIDEITNSSNVINGKAQVTLYGVDAGIDKNISVFYTGDNTYFNQTKNCNFTISKADLVFNISSDDIKIGQYAEITIIVPPKTTGTFSINGTEVGIPLSGMVTYIISDLEIGFYTISAVYEGNNYNSVSKNVSFTVSEYPYPQVANGGENTQNTQKSIYDTIANGEIAFTIPFNETISGDLVIDSFGNVYIPTQFGIYAFNQTNRLWYFTSSAAEGNLSGIAISRDIIIAPKSGDTLFFINQTSGEKSGSNIYQGSSLFAPVVDSEANVYIASEYQFDQAGRTNGYKLVIIPFKLWISGGDPTIVDLDQNAPLCAPTLNEDIIVIISENRFRIINSKTLETISIKSGNFQGVRSVIGEGNIVYSILSNTIVAYNSAGAQVWKTKVTGGVGKVLALDNEKGLYHVNAKGNIYRYDLFDGSEVKFTDLKVTSGILIDANNNLYFASNNFFYALDSEGNILWKSDLKSKVMGNPVMDASGLIYVPTENSIIALTYAPLKDAINVTVGDIFVGEDAEIIITADTQITSKFNYTVNGDAYSSEGGLINMTLRDLVAGNYTVEVSYAGDSRFNSQNQAFTFEVKKYAPMLATSFESSTHMLEIKLNSDATGNVTVTVGDEKYTVQLVNGSASVKIQKSGSYDVVIVYSGDSRYDSIKSSKFVVVNANDSNGGSNSNPSSSKPALNKVSKKTSKIVANKKTFKAKTKIKKYAVTLKSGNTPIRNVKLIIKIKGKTFKATTNAKGKATFKIKKLTKKGKYTATIKFAGNKNYKATSKKVKITVKK